MNQKQETHLKWIRLFDIIFSIIGIVLLFPFFIIILILSSLDTGSPLFIQTRVGKNRLPFKLIKFRTMHQNTASVATHLVSSQSVTKLGAFLRKTKLDELPQLYNVLIGHMSLVGPRPCLPNQEELIKEREDRKVFEVLPGITGLAQINNIDMSNPKRLSEKDREMITNLTVSQYLYYLVHTVFGKGSGDNIS